MMFNQGALESICCIMFFVLGKSTGILEIRGTLDLLETYLNFPLTVLPAADIES